MAERVFVYGSLKRGLKHHDQMDGAVFLGQTLAIGCYLVLYEEGYPALVAGDDQTEGELYEVTRAHLAHLDDFEECPTLYRRNPVTLQDGTTAWSYWLPPNQTTPWPRLKTPWNG